MKHDKIEPPLYRAVRIATDAECDDFEVQDRVQDFMRGLLAVASFRKIDEGLRIAAHRAGTALLDAKGDRARPLQLSDADYYKFGYWVRDWVERKGEDRRNQSRTLERRRYLITLMKMAWPCEMTTLGKSSDALGVEWTHHAPPAEWEF